jgi:hypothetical protein
MGLGVRGGRKIVKDDVKGVRVVFGTRKISHSSSSLFE